MDILVGLESGYIALYSGSDSGDSVPLLSSDGYLLSNGTPISHSQSSPSLYDYNRDGVDDLLVGAGNGKIHVYINTGTSQNYSYNNGYFLLENEFGEIDLGGNTVLQALDLNGDMLIDLIAGYRNISYENRIAFFEGNGPGAMFNFAPPVDLCSYWGDSTLTYDTDVIYPFAGDINSDGSADLVSGEYYGEVFVFMGEPGAGTYENSNSPVIKPSFSVLSNPVSQVSLQIQVETYGSSSLMLFDCSGRKISEEEVNSGNVNITVDMKNLPCGVYTVVLSSSSGISSQRITLLE